MKKRLIILAAGQGFKLDGFNKLLIKDPRTNEILLKRYKNLFNDYEITIVTGYKAIEIMSEDPNLNYVHNNQWRITGNSYSLSLALDERPCVVISSDFIFDKNMVEFIENAPENSVFVKHLENKGINTVRCKVKNSIVQSMYMGEQKDYYHPEAIGIFKISDPKILKEWKKNCSINKNVFAGINLPVENNKIFAVDKGDRFFHEINTHLDYLNLIKKIKER